MFCELSPTYDSGNRVLSLGLDRIWRRKMVAACGLGAGGQAIDFCCGTGDVAFELERMVQPGGHVIAVDFSAGMLSVARDKARRRNSAVEFLRGDVLKLGYADNYFDAATIAFGIRNLADTSAGIRELARLVRPGGVVAVLETGQPVNPLIAGLYRFYNKSVIPAVGGMISGKRFAYEYLHDTSTRFPFGNEFRDLMLQTGCFSTVHCAAQTFGVAWLYCGIVD
jgi:demethylmenaquinone methyltransferase/2-methoxy-6-polyprenyl-1,4-benzoquinol methylase